MKPESKMSKSLKTLEPAHTDRETDPLDYYRFPAKIEIVGDILSTFYSDDELEEFFEESCKGLE